MASDGRLQKGLRPNECGVCLNPYDEQERRPRVLPCGHTFCSECISTLLKDELLNCPSCRTNHRAPSIGHFPISFALEDVIRAMKTLQATADFQATEGASKIGGHTSQSPSVAFQTRGTDSKLKATVGLSKKMQSMIKEQKKNMKSLEVTLEKELEQLQEYRAQLALSVSEHSRMTEELDKYVQQHQATMGLLLEEDVKMEAFVEEGKEAQRELKAAQNQLDQANTAQKAIDTTVSIDSNIASVEMWLQRSKEEIPNGTALNTSNKVMETTEAALEVYVENAKATPVQISSGHLDCTIMEAVKNTKSRCIKLVDLSRKKLRKKMDAGQVFAVLKNKDGCCYSSKMTYEGHRVYMHCLQSQPPPEGASTLEVSKTLQNLNYFSTMVFMDLSSQCRPPASSARYLSDVVPSQPVMSKQRFHIRLEADTPLSKKFITLCSGHTGHTFCNTKMMRVENNYDGTLTVWRGDTCSQGTVSRGIFVPQMYHYQVQNSKAVTLSRGMVVSRSDVAHAEQSMEFGIVIDNHGIGNYPIQYMYSKTNPTICCLGRIETAELTSLEKLVTNPSFSVAGVKVNDCGVVLQQ